MATDSSGGRSLPVQELVGKGISVRKAQKAVNAVFDGMISALYRGEEVEIPGGTLHTERRPEKARREFHRFRHPKTKKVLCKLTRYKGSRRVVKFTADEMLDLTPPPPPRRSEETECRDLASELLGSGPADDQTMAVLNAAIPEQCRKPGALLRRLRELKSRGLTANDPIELARGVDFLYWL
jgi:nucleoid DNA-binding protein